MNVEEYTTANGWFSAMHGKGYKVPVVLCQAIEKIMKDEKVSFPIAYEKLDARNQIKFKDKAILFTSAK